MSATDREVVGAHSFMPEELAYKYARMRAKPYPITITELESDRVEAGGAGLHLPRRADRLDF